MVSREALARAVSGGLAVAALTIGGVGLSTASASASPRNPWDAIAQCESGGNWSIDTGNGYFGGLQFSAATWASYGGHGSAARASRAQQIAIGERVVARQGWSAWSACSARLGLHGHSSPIAAVKHVHHHRTHHSAKHLAAAHPHEDRSVARTHIEQEAHHRVGPRHAAPRSGRHAATPAVRRAIYTVRSGDTLRAIATRLDVTGGWEALADANAAHLAHPDRIVPGQVLHLPAR